MSDTAQHDNNATVIENDPRMLAQYFARFREPNHWRSVVEILITIVPLVALWILTWFALHIGYGLYLLVAVPASGFLVRLFMIQHDCGHGAFFRHRLANDWVGRVIGVLTLTPYDFWRRTHAAHHAISGNLDRRGMGDIDTLTVDEYLARSRWGRLCYRLYRHPLVMFGLGPAYSFPVPASSADRTDARPGGNPGSARWRRTWPSCWSRRSRSGRWESVPFLLVHLPIMLIGASLGVWLFYVQHQFEGTFWAHEKAWNMHEAALYGSSHYDLPLVLRWFTANIGVHHIHHLCSRIPFYRLPLALRQHPDIAKCQPSHIGQESLVRSTGALG